MNKATQDPAQASVQIELPVALTMLFPMPVFRLFVKAYLRVLTLMARTYWQTVLHRQGVILDSCNPAVVYEPMQTAVLLESDLQ
jgi:hypothetical protein